MTNKLDASVEVETKVSDLMTLADEYADDRGDSAKPYQNYLYRAALESALRAALLANAASGEPDTEARNDLLDEMEDSRLELMQHHGTHASVIGRAIDWILNAPMEPTITEPQPGAVQEANQKLIDWVVERWHAEVANRPMINVHRRTLDDTWRQMLRHLGVDDRERIGPTHDELRAEIGGKEWEAMNSKATS